MPKISDTFESLCCEMHVSHACHMHEPGTDARIWTCDVWWAALIGAAHICNIVWCICLSNTLPVAMACDRLRNGLCYACFTDSY